MVGPPYYSEHAAQEAGALSKDEGGRDAVGGCSTQAQLHHSLKLQAHSYLAKPFAKKFFAHTSCTYFFTTSWHPS